MRYLDNVLADPATTVGMRVMQYHEPTDIVDMIAGGAAQQRFVATFDGLAKYDLQAGTYERFDYGAGVFGSEAPFAPRSSSPEAPEDAGYVLSFMTDASDWSSSCWIFDAQDVARGPVAKVKLPHRVPAGFHATWIPGAELQSRSS